PASAVNVTASFSKIDYAVTTATGLTGGSVSADATAQYQDEVTVTATPETGYKLDAITVTDASGNAIAVADGKFTMPASAVSVTAQFSKIDYVINVVSEHGKVNVVETANYGDEVEFAIVADSSYQLKSVDVVGQSAITVTDGKFTMPASNVTITVTYDKILDFVKVIYMGFRADSTIDQVYQSIRIPDDANYIMGEYALLVSNEVSDNLQDYTHFDENATDVIDYNKYYGAAFMLGPKDGYVFANTITFVCGNDTAEVEPMNIPMSPTQSMQVVVHYQLNIKAFKHFHAYDFHRFEWAADSLSAVPVYQCESDQIDSLGVAVASVFSEKMVSCTNNGERKFNVEVEYKGVTYRDSISTIIPAWGHDWNDAVVAWDSITPAQVTDWTSVTTSSTTTRVCKTDNFVETETVNANFTITEQPTCVTAGAGYFKAEFENEAFESQIYEIEIPALGHDWDLTEYIWSTVSSTVDVDWSQVSSTCTAIHTCKVEGAKEVETVYATILVTEPTCTTEGLVMFTATFSNPSFGTQTNSTVLPMLEHNWSDVSYKWSSDNTTCTASRSCSVGGETERETATATRTVVVEPTATTEGKAVCSVTFSNSAFDSQEVEVVLPKLDAIADSELQMAKIWASNYQIVVENAMSQVVEVYTVNGSKVFSGVATSNRFEIDMAANTALYIVRVNNQVERVVLK
ncbi:MAG: hypothetical protein MJ069_08680, partial [Salinivirgaceae bacterium]|nr:hypothetical protein [Salinivirgaceae bacterium]